MDRLIEPTRFILVRLQRPVQRLGRRQVRHLRQLGRQPHLLQEQQLELQVDEAVVSALAEQGYEPEYGARPLRRVLRRSIENPLATELLEEHFSGAWGVRIEAAALQEGGGGGGLRFLPLMPPGDRVR